jgi:hypothetical protein
VTRRTTRQLFDARDLVFLHEPGAEAGVIRGPLPRHVVDLVARPHVFRRVAMAVDAPRHLQRGVLVDQRHLVHASVAGCATDPFFHVDTVVEVDKVGQIVDARPVERLVVAETGAHWLENRSIGPNLRMAIHAGLGGRNVGKCRLFDRRVAVAAVDAFAADMMLVAELNGLLDEHALIGVVAGQVEHCDAAAKGSGESDEGQDAQPGVDIGAAMKNLTLRVDARAASSKSLLETGAFAEAQEIAHRGSLRLLRQSSPNNVKFFTKLSNGGCRLSVSGFQLPVSGFQFPVKSELHSRVPTGKLALLADN